MRGDSAVPLPYPDAVQAPIHEHHRRCGHHGSYPYQALIGEAPILTGPERLNLRQQVDTIGEVIGRPVTVIQQTEEEATATLSRYVPEVWVRQILKDWRDAVGATPTISQEYTRITGKQPRSFRTWVEENADLFR